MSIELKPTVERPAGNAARTASTFPPPLRVPLTVVIVYWLIVFLTGWLELPTFLRFLPRLLAVPVMALTLLVWWWWGNRRQVAFRDRLSGFAIVFGLWLVAVFLAHPSMTGWTAFMLGLPVALTAGTVVIHAFGTLAAIAHLGQIWEHKKQRGWLPRSRSAAP